jgi:hypothetical protein
MMKRTLGQRKGELRMRSRHLAQLTLQANAFNTIPISQSHGLL